MPIFYRDLTKPEDKTIYQGYDSATKQLTGGISSEQEAQKLGVVPDWETTWKPQGTETNIKAINPAMADKPAFDINPPTILDSKTLADAYSTPATLPDIRKTYDDYLAEQKTLQDKYMASLSPAEEETTLETQLADLRKRASLEDTGAAQEISRLESQPAEVVRGIVEAQKGQFGKEYAFRQQTLAAQEKNLMDRLGIAQQKRTGVMEGIKTALGFGKEKIDTYQKMYDAIQAEQDKIVARADKLSDNARQTIVSILDKFKGLTLDGLTPEVQGQLATLATRAGIPLSILQAGLKSQKDQLDFENLLKAQKTMPSMSDKYGTGIIGEYNYYAEQEKAAGRKPVSFDAYQTADANRKAKANTTTIKSETGANFNTRLNEEITSLKNGWYGKEGAREKVINALKAEFPNMDINQIGKYVMARVQDGYEKNIKDKTSGTTMILKDGSMITF